MKLLILLSFLLFGCGSLSFAPPHMDNRIQSKVVEDHTILYDTHLDIFCQSTKDRYVLDPPRCIPGLGKVMYSNQLCTDPDSMTPTQFLEIPAKYGTSTDIGQFYELDTTAKLKGPGLYEIVDKNCESVLNARTAFDIKNIASYQIFGDL